MARTKRNRRAYSAGEWGRNRVRIFPRSQDRLFPDRVAGERAQARPVAETPRLGRGRGGRRISSPPGSSTRRMARPKLSPSRSPWKGFLTFTETRSPPSGGVPRMRRPGTSTGHRSRSRCSLSWRRRGCGAPTPGTLPCCPRRKTHRDAWTGLGVRVWWQNAETLAVLEPKRGRGWHSLRRKFASDLMDQPLKVLCELGGWKTPHTILQCYQHADVDRLREALEDRRRVCSRPN